MKLGVVEGIEDDSVDLKIGKVLIGDIDLGCTGIG
jgi:hypothetical protein